MLAQPGQSGTPIASPAILAAIACADALPAKRAQAVSQQDHAAAPRLLREVLGNRLTETQERRPRRLLSRKDEVQYGARAITLDVARQMLEDLDGFALRAADLLCSRSRRGRAATRVTASGPENHRIHSSIRSMSEDASPREAVPPSPPPEPLCTLDLRDNGGRFAPTSFDELSQWLETERAFWQWLRQGHYGSHDQHFRQALDQLDMAMATANEASHHQPSNPEHAKAQLQGCRSHIENAFVHTRLPHSSTPLAKRIEMLRQQAGDKAATFYAAVFVPPQQGYQFQPNDLDSWRGLVEGLIDRFDLAATIDERRKRAAEESFEELRGQAEQLVADKREAYEELHRDYNGLAEAIRRAADEQARQFEDAQRARQETFTKLTDQHARDMEALRKTFREEIALRAPAEYWESKRNGHRRMAWITGAASFVGILAAAGLLGWQIHDVLIETPRGSTPEPWRVVVLALIAVFLVWAIRLIVRMFLSHLHLLTDAGERVVMVQTYLSLLEGDRLASKEDRQLILQALFRPAADGIVKDEGVPPSYLEWLTRGPK